ncbi:MAG: SEC-C domain-containing protein, partial [Desulfuromusa sp.]|nr:SEC-C domain-containing protein [Desulfuromusa sp.]
QLQETYQGIISDTVEDIIGMSCTEKTPSTDWDWNRLDDSFLDSFNFPLDLTSLDVAKVKYADLERLLENQAKKHLQEKEEEFTTPIMEHLMRVLLLQTIDSQWKDHLLSVDHLKEGIGLRGYGQKNPKEEYKREAYSLFMEMMARVREEVLQKIFRIQLAREEDVEQMEAQQRQQKMSMNRSDGGEQAKKPATREEDKIGRNDPCPCGSGKKYKKCCGK